MYKIAIKSHRYTPDVTKENYSAEMCTIIRHITKLSVAIGSQINFAAT